MKRTLALFISLVLVFALTAGVANAADDIEIYIDGVLLDAEVAPMIINNRVMLPLRAIGEAVGCIVNWIDAERRIDVIFPGGSAKMYIGDPDAIVSALDADTGQPVTGTITLDSPPVIKNSRALVPLRFVAELIGYDVRWDAATRKVYMTSPDPGTDSPMQPEWEGWYISSDGIYLLEITVIDRSSLRFKFRSSDGSVIIEQGTATLDPGDSFRAGSGTAVFILSDDYELITVEENGVNGDLAHLAGDYTFGQG